MISYPRNGQTVQVWYRPSVAATAPLHGRVGTVAIIARGPGPRNHGIILSDRVAVVPAGNLRTPRT